MAVLAKRRIRVAYPHGDRQRRPLRPVDYPLLRSFYAKQSDKPTRKAA